MLAPNAPALPTQRVADPSEHVLAARRHEVQYFPRGTSVRHAAVKRKDLPRCSQVEAMEHQFSSIGIPPAGGRIQFFLAKIAR